MIAGQVRKLLPFVALISFAFAWTAADLQAAEPTPQELPALENQYADKIRPLLEQYCLDCHSTEDQEGELDLEQFATFRQVRDEPDVWSKVADVLSNGEMPPEDEDAQPSEAERKLLQTWIQQYLHAEALANAGDPGPVVLRRLNNAEYTYTIRDLTKTALDPAREFPVDGAAGEGFTNTGNSLVMSSPLLTKYFDAGKEIASHAVLLPEGFRFSESPNRATWSNEALTAIRDFYQKYAAGGNGTNVNLQGVQFKTNDGGRLNFAPYLAATLADRTALTDGTQTVDEVAQARGLNPKYLGILWDALHDPEPSLLIQRLQQRWRTASEQDVAALAGDIDLWQSSLFRFASVGHIGKKNGPQAWQEPVTPVATRQELRITLPEKPSENEIVLYLVTGDAGDGNEHDMAIWERPRIVMSGRPDLLLRDVPSVFSWMKRQQERLIGSTVNALMAADALADATGPVDVRELAKSHNVDPDLFEAWLDYLLINPTASPKLDYFTNRLTSPGGFEFVQGWGVAETPNVYANSSDQHVRIPGNMKPHGVVVHPSPAQNAVVGWRSPVSGLIRIEGQITHAHPECGNGVAWSLERRHGTKRQRLASGIAQGGAPVQIEAIENLAMQSGDLISLVIAPRDGNHACDLTDVELILTSQSDTPKRWSLTEDVAPDRIAANPHADRFGNEGIWHFYQEPIDPAGQRSMIPPGSLMARWQAAEQSAEKRQLAEAIQSLLTTGPPADSNDADAILYRQLTAFQGEFQFPIDVAAAAPTAADDGPGRLGLDPARFGRRTDGSPLDPASLGVHAPSVLEVRLPAELVAGGEFVTGGILDDSAKGEGSVQFRILTVRPDSATGLIPPPATDSKTGGSWTSDQDRTIVSTPVIVEETGPARSRFERAFQDFRQLFPAALCYSQIVPVDEVVTLTLYYREDEALQRLMLNEAQQQELNRLWRELHFISRDAITLVDAFEQLLEYASQDGDPSVFDPLREPIKNQAAQFQQKLLDAEPLQVDALIQFASNAYRRPLTKVEISQFHALYRELIADGLSHDEAFRFLMTRIFVAPAFLYRLETAPAGTAAAEVSDWELATRLSYFLWSSQPDEELRAVAAAGQLHDPAVLSRQAKRMLASPKIERLAQEFACQWLQIYQFDELDEKSSEAFPEFLDLRADMHREAILFFTDLFQSDASVLEILEADHAILNQRLANFYGISLGDDVPVDAWKRVENVRPQGRGGILGLGAALAKHSGASRSSPILRGIWVSETLLGEKLPNPPAGVPPLPEDNSGKTALSVRELTELHTKEPACANCHQRVDPFGFALENFDAIGRFQQMDPAGKPLNTQATLLDGSQFEGAEGLRQYLLQQRREAVLRQFCRKLLGYALGRSIQVSDEPLLTEMQQQLADNDYRFSVAIEAILASRQFQEIRGRDRVDVAAH